MPTARVINKQKACKNVIQLIKETVPFYPTPQPTKYKNTFLIGYERIIQIRPLTFPNTPETSPNQEERYIYTLSLTLFSWIKKKIGHLLHSNNQYTALISLCMDCGSPTVIESEIVMVLYFYKRGGGAFLQDAQQKLAQDISRAWLQIPPRISCEPQEFYANRRKKELLLFLTPDSTETADCNIIIKNKKKYNNIIS